MNSAPRYACAKGLYYRMLVTLLLTGSDDAGGNVYEVGGASRVTLERVFSIDLLVLTPVMRHLHVYIIYMTGGWHTHTHTHTHTHIHIIDIIIIYI